MLQRNVRLRHTMPHFMLSISSCWKSNGTDPARNARHTLHHGRRHSGWSGPSRGPVAQQITFRNSEEKMFKEKHSQFSKAGIWNRLQNLTRTVPVVIGWSWFLICMNSLYGFISFHTMQIVSEHWFRASFVLSPLFRRLEIGGCILNIFVDLREYIYSIPVYIFMFVNKYLYVIIHKFVHVLTTLVYQSCFETWSIGYRHWPSLTNLLRLDDTPNASPGMSHSWPMWCCHTKCY